MKVTHVHIENFKRFSPPGTNISLRRPGDEGTISNQFLLLGDNGAGKTTVLQAIALTLSLATKQTRAIDQLRWVGWAGDRYYSKGDPVVEVTVQFTKEEIEATHTVAKRWSDSMIGGTNDYIDPGDEEVVKLRLVGPTLEAVGAGVEQINQFRGRALVSDLVRRGQFNLLDLFHRLPGVYWFDQFRSVAMVGKVENGARNDESAWELNSFQLGLDHVKSTLDEWLRVQSKGWAGTRLDLLGELNRLYGEVFPNRKFAGFEPVYSGGPTPTGSRPTLTDGSNTYDLREMSAGEQAVFPLIFEFIRQQVHHSVVLIDEIDLNLHPPLAQRLLALLPRLGLDNQFLFTTHASAVSSMVSPRDTFRLPGGNLCL